MSNTRLRAKEILGACNTNFDWVLKHLKDFSDRGYGDRQEFEPFITGIANAVIELQKGINKLIELI